MTAIFRKTLMATTVLAGLAIFAFDTAQAGPNGPSFGGGSISGVSSMRMDFNPRIGDPGRALSRDDRRIVPLDVKTAEKSKDTRTPPRRTPTIARVSIPSPQPAARARKSPARPGCVFRHRSPKSIA